jgi:hypothetical protein
MKLRERTKQKKSRVSLSLLLLFFRSVVTESRAQEDEFHEGIWRAPYSSLFLSFHDSNIFLRTLSLSSLRFARTQLLAFYLIFWRGDFFCIKRQETEREGQSTDSRRFCGTAARKKSKITNINERSKEQGLHFLNRSTWRPRVRYCHRYHNSYYSSRSRCDLFSASNRARLFLARSCPSSILSALSHTSLLHIFLFSSTLSRV